MSFIIIGEDPACSKSISYGIVLVENSFRTFYVIVTLLWSETAQSICFNTNSFRIFNLGDNIEQNRNIFLLRVLLFEGPWKLASWLFPVQHTNTVLHSVCVCVVVCVRMREKTEYSALVNTLLTNACSAFVGVCASARGKNTAFDAHHRQYTFQRGPCRIFSARLSCSACVRVVDADPHRFARTFRTSRVNTHTYYLCRQIRRRAREIVLSDFDTVAAAVVTFRCIAAIRK